MSRNGAIWAVLSLFLLVLQTPKAHAIEKLNYNDTKIPHATLVKIKKYFPNNTKDIQIARADLNEDGIFEIFVRTLPCDLENKLCHHYVLAEKEGALITLDEIDARQIALGNEKISGVRNLLVFKNVLNDFDYDVYTWKAKDRKFAQKE